MVALGKVKKTIESYYKFKNQCYFFYLNLYLNDLYARYFIKVNCYEKDFTYISNSLIIKAYKC